MKLLIQIRMIGIIRRAPQGARGLKYFLWESGSPLSRGRAPQGARGLKSFFNKLHSREHTSRPARGAWVEMGIVTVKRQLPGGRAPQGARGLKFH